VSYNKDLTEFHVVSCKNIIEHDFYKLLFPKTAISKDLYSKVDFMITALSGMFSTSIQGGLTGRN